MWNFLKRLFGFGKKPAPVESVKSNVVSKPTAAPVPASKTVHTRANVKREQYYRRNGKFYQYDDDSEIEDLILLAILLDVFSDDIEMEERAEATEVLNEMEEPNIEDMIEASTTVVDIDAAVAEVRETYVAPEPTPTPTPTPTPEPAYSAPEPSYSTPEPSYSDSSSSSYDSGGSDSGGSFD